MHDLLFPAARAIPGFISAYLGIDPESGRGISFSVWESDAAVQAADEVVAGSAARRATGTLPEPEAVARYEVVHHASRDGA